MTTSECALMPDDIELIDRLINNSGDDVAVSISRSFERLEERIDGLESRLYGRLAELEDLTEANRQSLSDELGDIRSDMRVARE